MPMGTSIYRGSLLVLNAVTRNVSLLPRSSGDMTAIFLPCKNSKFPLSLRLRYCPFSTTSARSCTNSLAFIPCSSLRDRMCCSPQVSSPHMRSMSPISSRWNAPLTCPRFSCMSLSTDFSESLADALFILAFPAFPMPNGSNTDRVSCFKAKDFRMMLRGRNAGNSLHIGKIRSRKSAEKNCFGTGSCCSRSA